MTRGQRIFRQGQRPDHLHLLLDGTVSLTAAAPRHGVAVADVLRAPDMFMLAPVLLDAPYPVSAAAVSEGSLGAIDLPRLRRLMSDEPGLAAGLAKAVAGDAQRLMAQVTDLKLRSAAQRLGCFLLGLWREQGGRDRVVLPYDKRLLAGRLGTTPENLSRAFALLRGYAVETRGSDVQLNDVPKLTAFAQPDG